MPEGIVSHGAMAFIQQLLDVNESSRLGSPLSGGVLAIKQHPFFAGVDWDRLERKQVDPPFKPRILDTFKDLKPYARYVYPITYRPYRLYRLYRPCRPYRSYIPYITYIPYRLKTPFPLIVCFILITVRVSVRPLNSPTSHLTPHTSHHTPHTTHHTSHT